jgi:hypothetical protein
VSSAEQESVVPTLNSWAGNDYPKHLPFYHMKDEWAKVVEETSGKKPGRRKVKPVARYIHTLTREQIRQMEFECITREHRQPISQAKPNVGAFWQKMLGVIGASLGQETEFIRVEVDKNGVYHGRPVTVQQLRDEGVPWDQLK